MKKNYKFTPDWISGFTQSDGSFLIYFQKQKNGIPIRPVPLFNLTQSITELDLFKELQKYLEVPNTWNKFNNINLIVLKIIL